ncbi:MAG: hypothetical protein J6O61_13025 [Butyrivibrio sp.]|nr:hypothetical protein [Butyrivibrio sp.]MBO6241742.1 hypothetical protein [Butyrivibrio sp.]
MLNAIDFSEYELNGKFYGGSERKEGITIDGDDYMIKYLLTAMEQIGDS